MATRRMSRGAPATLTAAEQRAWLEALEQDPELMSALEAHTGKPLAQMTGQEKLVVLKRHQEAGFALLAMNSATRARRDALALAGQIRGDEDVSAQLDAALRREEEARMENERLREHVERLQALAPARKAAAR